MDVLPLVGPVLQHLLLQPNHTQCAGVQSPALDPAALTCAGKGLCPTTAAKASTTRSCWSSSCAVRSQALACYTATGGCMCTTGVSGHPVALHCSWVMTGYRLSYCGPCAHHAVALGGCPLEMAPLSGSMSGRGLSRRQLDMGCCGCGGHGEGCVFVGPKACVKCWLRHGTAAAAFAGHAEHKSSSVIRLICVCLVTDVSAALNYLKGV